MKRIAVINFWKLPDPKRKSVNRTKGNVAFAVIVKGTIFKHCYVFTVLKTFKYQFVDCNKQSKNKCVLVSIKVSLLAALSYVPLFKLIPQ